MWARPSQRGGANGPAADVQARRAGHWWGPAGLVWAGVNLAAAGVGLFPELAAAGGTGGQAPLPALRVLAAVQMAFLLAVYPLVLLARAQRGGAPAWPGRLGEAALWALVAAPFVAACGYLSDAARPDIVRTALAVAAGFPVAWGLAVLARRGGAGLTVATLAMALLVLGAPAALYLAEEFWPGGAPAGLARVSPVLLAWQTCAPRQPGWVPQPLWAWLGWPALGAAVMILGRRGEKARALEW